MSKLLECKGFVWPELFRSSTESKAPTRIRETECCNQTMELMSWYSLCWVCGKMDASNRQYVTTENDYKIVYNHESHVKSYPRANYPSAPRRSDPMNNFRSVLRKYFGDVDKVRSRESKIISADVDLADPEAANVLKRIMLDKKKKYMIPRIFGILYYLNPEKNHKEAMRHIPRIEKEYRCMVSYFNDNYKRYKRTSMPNTWMMLEFILRLLKCPSYYRLPVVANARSCAVIEKFLSDYSAEVIDKRQDSSGEIYDVLGIWLH